MPSLHSRGVTGSTLELHTYNPDSQLYHEFLSHSSQMLGYTKQAVTQRCRRFTSESWLVSRGDVAATLTLACRDTLIDCLVQGNSSEYCQPRQNKWGFTSSPPIRRNAHCRDVRPRTCALHCPYLAHRTGYWTLKGPGTWCTCDSESSSPLEGRLGSHTTL